MFGHPQWFRKKRWGWGLVPVCRQGWFYSAVWMAAITLPFLLLLARHQALQALVWAVAMMTALVLDVRGIMRQIDEPLSPAAHDRPSPHPTPDSEPTDVARSAQQEPLYFIGEDNDAPESEAAGGGRWSLLRRG